jgi:hypothetical protein
MDDPYVLLHPEDARAWKSVFALGPRILEKGVHPEVPAADYWHGMRCAEIRLFAQEGQWDYFPEIGRTAFFHTQGEWEKFFETWIAPYLSVWREVLRLIPRPTRDEEQWWNRFASTSEKSGGGDVALMDCRSLSTEQKEVVKADAQEPIKAAAKSSPPNPKNLRVDPRPELPDHLVWSFLLQRAAQEQLPVLFAFRKSGATIENTDQGVQTAQVPKDAPIRSWMIDEASKILKR